MMVDFSYSELKHIAYKVGADSWQLGIAETIEKKCKAAMPVAKEQEDAADKKAKIEKLKAELAELESSP